MNEQSGVSLVDGCRSRLRSLPGVWQETIRGSKNSVVFPDGADERVLAAARALAAEGMAESIVLGDVVEVTALDERVFGASEDGVAISDVRALDSFPDLVVTLSEAYEARGRDISQAEAERLAVDPLMGAMLLTRVGTVNACVAGNTSTTGDVIRAALRVLGTEPGVGLVSSSYLFFLRDGRVVTYGDCGVVVAPDEQQLAEIAMASADTHVALTGEPARVAMLSFSTKGSAEHDYVDLVRAATELVRERRPDLPVDGELQFDAAFVPEVGQRKASASSVAGKANVFIFPDLNAGNIACKITEHVGGARGYGPLLQGLAGSANDLSRGCSASDVAVVSIISLVQSHAQQISG
jgi:phosphotransacetylase